MKQYPVFWGIVALVPFLGLISSFDHRKENHVSVGEVTSVPCDASFRSFGHLEKVTYKMYYNWNFVWIEAGEVTFEVREEKNEYYYRAVGKTKPSYEWFYKVHDVYESRVRKSDHMPVWSRRQVAEGKYRLYHEHWMDHEKGVARSIRGKSKETATERIVPIEDCFQDILSIIYFMRNSGIHEYKKGEQLPVRLFIDDSIYQVRVRYMGLEKDKRIKGLGKADVQRVIPDLVAGNVFSEEAKMNIWVSGDDNRLPLMVESPIVVGSVKAILDSHAHLLVPLNIKS